MLKTFTAVGLIVSGSVGVTHAQQLVDERRPAGSDGTVKISVPAGSVRVVRWARDSVAVTGTLEGKVRLEFSTENRETRIRVLVPRGQSAASGADLEINVPRASHVAIRTITAEIDVSGEGSAVDAESQSGNVTIKGSLRTVYAETAGGDIRLDVSTKILRAKSVNGSVTVRGARGYVEISTVSGNATLAAHRLWEGEISTVSGDILFEGGFDHPGSLSVDSHGGLIELLLSPSIDADFDLVNVKGRVENEFARSSERTFSSGSGGTQIKVKSFKGTVKIKKR